MRDHRPERKKDSRAKRRALAAVGAFFLRVGYWTLFVDGWLPLALAGLLISVPFGIAVQIVVAIERHALWPIPAFVWGVSAMAFALVVMAEGANAFARARQNGNSMPKKKELESKIRGRQEREAARQEALELSKALDEQALASPRASGKKRTKRL